jgi:y4mF family transcriptional regulator
MPENSGISIDIAVLGQHRLMPEKAGKGVGMPDPRKTTPARHSPTPEIARIGELIAARRIQLGLTQHLLADLAGVSRYSVQSLEYGTGSVKLGSVAQIAEALGLRLDITTADGSAL